MRNIKYIFFLIIIISCKKEASEGIPSYIQIDTIILNEETTANITDAWVYINDQLQGVYELPALFPVLKKDTQIVRIRAGIKNNGIASSRIPYPFYKSFIEWQTVLIPDEITIINPTVSYLENTSLFNEDFEGVGLDLESTNNSNTEIIILNDSNENYGLGILYDSLFTFEIATDELVGLPQAGAPVFLELDYKCNTEFLVGLYVNYSTSVEQKGLLWINEKDDWNKIYVNLTSTISESINANSFKLFIDMPRNFNIDTNKIYFDNIRIVY